jgi:hypothetical protein
MARVFLGRRSRGRYFLFLYASRSADFCFCDITVSTRAMEVRTTLLQNQRGVNSSPLRFHSVSRDGHASRHERGGAYILDSLLGAPPVTLATRRRESSDLSSLSCASSSALFFSRSSCTLIRAAAQQLGRQIRKRIILPSANVHR